MVRLTGRFRDISQDGNYWQGLERIGVEEIWSWSSSWETKREKVISVAERYRCAAVFAFYQASNTEELRSNLFTILI